MKSSTILLAALGLTFTSLSAQTVPAVLNYQGTVTDSTGVGLGDSSPVNRKVLFRIYETATAGSPIWTEEQTVTISKGEFSVLLGQGIAFSPEAHDSLLTVFGEGATDRYLAITVDNGDGTLNGSDLPIEPRQRITSTAYSFRAGTADSIASGSSLKLNTADSGLGYYDSSRQFGGIAVNGPVLYGAGGGALGVDNGAGTQTTALRWDSGGDVGIGVNAPLAGQKLHVAGSSYFDGSVKIVSPTATAFTIQSPTAGGYGLKHTNGTSSLETWVSPGQANLESNGTLNILAASTLSLFTNNVPRLVVNSTGKVGIGTADPAASLEIGGANNRTNAFRITGTQPGIYFNNTSGKYWNQWVPGNGEAAASGALVFYNGPSGGYRMVIEPDGDVGIGTTTPAANLHVVGVETEKMTLGSPAGVTFAVGNNAGQYGLNFGVNGNGDSWMQGGRTDGSTTAYHINLQASGGNVGIGTTSPSRGKLEIVGSGTGPSQTFAVGYGAYTATGAAYYPGAGPFASGSLYCSSWAVANAFYAHSDERIKDIIGVSDGTDDLSILMEIEVTDYTLKDKVSKGAAEYKKVIAQQVESVYPKAVIQSTDTIPDIYAKADAQSDWVQLATDLKVGERVRLINEQNDDVYEVLEVEQDRFRTELVTEGEWVFVFGREVDDFRNVDYEALAVLNISATQQLARQLVPNSSDIASLKQENLQLKTRLAALEAKDAARDARLAAIEQLLASE